MLVFLALNGIELNYTQEELARAFWEIADGKLDGAALLQWILSHEV